MAEMNEHKYEQVFNVGPHAELTLRNVRGGIDISGWDRPQVSVVAVKIMGTEWGASESFEQTTVEMEQDGPRVRVRTRRAGSGGLFGWLGIGRTPPKVAYTIKVPATSDVSVRTVNGKLSISDVIGSVYLRTVEGEIFITRVSGQIITSSVSGDVRGSEVGGAVASKAVDGGVTLTQSQLTSFSLKSVSGSARIETSIDPAGTYEVGSVDGSFHLMVPPDSRASAELSGISGRASCDLPCRVVDGGHGPGRSHWQGVVNGGGATISLRTVSGDLSITSATNLPKGAAPTPPPAPTAAAPSQEWPEMDILKAVERGELSVEDAIAKLGALDKGN